MAETIQKNQRYLKNSLVYNYSSVFLRWIQPTNCHWICLGGTSRLESDDMAILARIWNESIKRMKKPTESSAVDVDAYATARMAWLLVNGWGLSTLYYAPVTWGDIESLKVPPINCYTHPIRRQKFDIVEISTVLTDNSQQLWNTVDVMTDAKNSNCWWISAMQLC